MDICLIAMALILISYNCKGFNISKVPFINLVNVMFYLFRRHGFILVNLLCVCRIF